MFFSKSTLALLAVAMMAAMAPTTAQEEVSAATTSVYSFRSGGLSSPDGLERGHKGLNCFRNMLGTAKLDAISTTDGGGSVTEDNLSAAIFMSFGQDGIERVCNIQEQKEEELDENKNNRFLRQQQHQQQQHHRQTHEGGGARQGDCSSVGTSATYLGTTDANTYYSPFMDENELDDLLPNPSDLTQRTNPTKMISLVQVVLDEALEAEYSANLCASYFSAVTNILSIPDLVFVKQGMILDGINELSCGLGQGLAKSTQTEMRKYLALGREHDSLVNRAEIDATYQNMASGVLCRVSEQVSSLMDGATSANHTRV